MKRLASSILVLASSLMLQAQVARTCIYSRSENGFDTYRIPALVQAKDGTILAFAEARKNSSEDTGDIDIVVKRSSDGGRTWSGIITVWDDGENVCGNPCPVVDRETGRIVLLANWNKGSDTEWDIHSRVSEEVRKVFVLTSDDNGLTWSAPREITSQTKDPEWTWYATGPCHAIQLKDGRMVVPCNHGVFIDGKPAGTYSHVICSDDGGENWHIGGCPDIGNESTVVELDNGDIILNMRSWWSDDRSESGYARIAAVSHDRGESFDAPFYVEGLVEPICNASIIDYSPAGRRTGRILFSNPEHISKRCNMTIRMSCDGGAAWTRVCTLEEGPAAYSDLCVLPDGDVAALYESGRESPYESIMFARVDKKLFSKRCGKRCSKRCRRR